MTRLHLGEAVVVRGYEIRPVIRTALCGVPGSRTVSGFASSSPVAILVTTDKARVAWDLEGRPKDVDALDEELGR